MQGAGAGAIFPLATAAAGHLFEGPARARAIGLVGALSFLGMACGPFVGATILQAFVMNGGPLFAPSWRWVFYLGAPFALLAGIYTWATARGWPRPSGDGSLDLVGAALFTTGVACGLIALTSAGGDDATVPGAFAAISVIALVAALLVWFRRAKDPFFDLSYFRDRTFSGAMSMSLLTGYAFATAVDRRGRVHRPRSLRRASGAAARAGLAGRRDGHRCPGSGYLVRPMGVMLPSVAGLVAEVCRPADRGHGPATIRRSSSCAPAWRCSAWALA